MTGDATFLGRGWSFPPEFGPGGAEHLYLQQLQGGTARPRPQTPAYPAITAAFAIAGRA